MCKKRCGCIWLRKVREITHPTCLAAFALGMGRHFGGLWRALGFNQLRGLSKPGGLLCFAKDRGRPVSLGSALFFDFCGGFQPCQQRCLIWRLAVFVFGGAAWVLGVEARGAFGVGGVA